MYHYTMCKRIAEPVARTVGVCSRLRSCSDIGRLAAQLLLREAHSDERFGVPSASFPNRWCLLEEASERIRGKRAFQGMPGVCLAP